MACAYRISANHASCGHGGHTSPTLWGPGVKHILNKDSPVAVCPIPSMLKGPCRAFVHAGAHSIFDARVGVNCRLAFSRVAPHRVRHHAQLTPRFRCSELASRRQPTPDVHPMH
eukprot:363610-Chlamydomonas_euryale.AAC.6